MRPQFCKKKKIWHDWCHIEWRLIIMFSRSPFRTYKTVSILLYWNIEGQSQGHIVAQQPINLFSFRFTSIGPAIPEIQLFKILPWKFKVKVMPMVITNGYIWGLVLNRYVTVSLRGNRTVFCWEFISNLAIPRSKATPATGLSGYLLTN